MIPEAQWAENEMMDWNTMVIQNDLLPWTNWPIIDFQYGTIENAMDVSNDVMPTHYQTM